MILRATERPNPGLRDHGKVTSLDFFELSACFDSAHGDTSPTAFGHVSNGDTGGPVRRVPQVESFVLYDHCAAPAWPFGTKDLR